MYPVHILTDKNPMKMQKKKKKKRKPYMSTYTQSCTLTLITLYVGSTSDSHL